MTYFDFLTPIILFVVGILYKMLPNHKLNSPYGYASSYAKKSDAVWLYAQKIVPIICVIGSLVLTVFIILIKQLPLGLSAQMIENLLNYAPYIFTVSLLALTEIQLRRKYDKNGIKKIK